MSQLDSAYNVELQLVLRAMDDDRLGFNATRDIGCCLGFLIESSTLFV